MSTSSPVRPQVTGGSDLAARVDPRV